MKDVPLFSIIIPLKSINDYVRETVVYIKRLTTNNWELIILPNAPEADEWNDQRIRLEVSGNVGPAEKRDMGARLATGKFLAFLDDDSFPEADFLEIAKQSFEENDCLAIGGPAMTPATDSFWQRVSGAVFLSKFSGGFPERYVPVGEVREVDDWPSVNLIVYRDIFLQLGGFDSQYWPGEDTKFCMDLVGSTGKRILYVPRMLVWHHRRSGLRAHLKQIGGYGLHRGYFAKKYPKTSRRLTYFIPTIFLVFVCLSFLVPFLLPSATVFFLVGWATYLVALVIAWFDICRYETRLVAFFSTGYTIITHLWYGIKFLQGLLTSKLISKLR